MSEQWTPEVIAMILGQEAKERTDPKAYARRLPPYVSYRRADGASDADISAELGYAPYRPVTEAKD